MLVNHPEVQPLPRVARPQPWARTEAPKPGLPALIPTEGNPLLSAAFVCCSRGRGSPCQAQQSLSSKIPPPLPGWHWSSSSFPGAAGWLPCKASQTHTGCGPAPQVLAPCHHPLVARSPALPGPLLLSPPQGLGGSSAAASMRFDEEATPAGTPCLCFQISQWLPGPGGWALPWGRCPLQLRASIPRVCTNPAFQSPRQL